MWATCAGLKIFGKRIFNVLTTKWLPLLVDKSKSLQEYWKSNSFLSIGNPLNLNAFYDTHSAIISSSVRRTNKTGPLYLAITSLLFKFTYCLMAMRTMFEILCGIRGRASCKTSSKVASKICNNKTVWVCGIDFQYGYQCPYHSLDIWKLRGSV